MRLAATPGRPQLRLGYLARNPLLLLRLAVSDAALGLLRARSGGPASPPDAPRRVLVAIGGHLGDAVIASAVLPQIRARWPAAEIGVLGGSWLKPVLEGHPLVARWHVADHWKLNRGARGWAERLRRHSATRRKALAEIRSLGYEVAIDLYPFFPNQIPLLWRAGVPVRAGFTSGGSGPLLTHAAPWEESDRHLAEIQLSLVDRVAPAPGPTPLQYSLPERGFDPELLPRGLRPGSYLVLHMGAGLALKEWPVERWRTLVARLAAEGHRLVFTGSGGDQAEKAGAAIADEPGCLNLCDELGWREFVSTVGNARLVITVDSVTGHLAAAAGVPVVVLMSGMNPIAQWRPLGDGVSVVTVPVPCAPCNRSRGCAAMTCVRGIEVAGVLRSVHDRLGAELVAETRSEA